MSLLRCPAGIQPPGRCQKPAAEGAEVTKLLLQKRLGALRPLDDSATEALRTFSEGEVISIDMPKRPRNVNHHRLFFALLNLVFENTDGRFVSIDHLLTAVKIGTGHADLIALRDGTEIWHPKSISFAKMDQTAFRQFWDKAIDWIIANVLPVGKRELENEVFGLLGFDLENAR